MLTLTNGAADSLTRLPLRAEIDQQGALETPTGRSR